MTRPITPNPGIHKNPAQASPSTITSGPQTGALQIALFDGILAQILLALANINLGGETLGQAFPLLQQWATQLQQDARNALAGANTAGATAIAAQQTANSSQALATTAIVTSSQGLTNWTGLLAALELTDVPGLSDWLSTAFTNAENAWNHWIAVLEAQGQADIAAFNSFLNSLISGQIFQSLLDSVANALGHAGTGHTITDIESYLGLIPPANVTNVLDNGNTTLNEDLTQLATQLFGAPAVNYITTVEQDIVNFIQNALSGGNAATSSNSPAAALFDALLNIPHTNVVIPPSPGSGSITWDANASGTPYTSFTNNFITINYNHTCAATANYLTVRLGFYSIYLPAISVTYNGISMSPLTLETGTDGDTYVMVYGLANPPTGTAQVSVTMYSPLGNAIESVAVESDSYIGVGSVSSTAAANGADSNPALTVPSATGDYIIQTFFNTDSFGAGLSSYNQTSQYNSGNINPSSGPKVCLLAGDAAGAASVSFTAIAADTTANRWAAAAVNLTPLPATVIGSVFRAANTSTSSVSAASGDNFFPNSFFNSTTAQSSDLTYSAASGNTVTITHAGTYSVTIAVLLVSTFSAQLLGLSLQQNFAVGGASLKRGHTSYINNPGFSTNYVVSHTFQVYCSAGDALQPCYYSSTSGSAFTGTSDGLSTYFEVSLNNRGLHS